MNVSVEMQNGIANAPAVLVVEDESVIRMMLVDELEDAGIAVIEANGADAAIAIMRNGAAICLVVTDVRMPGTMDGLGLAAWMRHHAPSVPIIITSGFVTESDCKAINPAVRSIISKPYSAKNIVGMVALLSQQDTIGTKPVRFSPLS